MLSYRWRNPNPRVTVSSITFGTMNSRLAPFLKQTNEASAGLGAFNFRQPKIFTNAILHSGDVTSLIRDTETHERALFTVPSSGQTSERSVQPLLRDKKQRMSMAPRRNTAVHSVLGSDMIEQLRRGGGGGPGGGIGGSVPGEVDVELLLLGAEKLNGVYHITKAGERIERARERYEQLAESVANYEALVAAQRQQLELLQHRDDYDDELPVPQQVEAVTDEMIEQEEQAIVELERKKEDMEKKIKGIDRKMNSVYQSLRE